MAFIKLKDYFLIDWVHYLLFLHLFISIALIALVIVQQGKGSDISANFSGGGSQTLFGSRGAAPFLTKVTAVLMGLFFASSLALGYSMGHRATLKQRLNTGIQHTAMPSKKQVHSQKTA